MTKDEAKDYLENYRKMYADLAPEKFLEALDIVLATPSMPSKLEEMNESAKELAYKTWSDGENWSDAAIKTFQAGAEWLAAQGITIKGDTDDEYVHILEEIEKAICTIAPDSTVTVQVRK